MFRLKVCQLYKPRYNAATLYRGFTIATILYLCCISHSHNQGEERKKGGLRNIVNLTSTTEIDGKNGNLQSRNTTNQNIAIVYDCFTTFRVKQTFCYI